MKNYTFIALVVIAAFTGVGYYALDYIDEKMYPLPVYGVEGHEIESFSFDNQLGTTFHSEQHKGKIWVVNYFFTSCPSICPKMMRNMQSVHDVVRSEEDIILLSLTVDPKRDTPEKFYNYLSNFNVDHSSWQLLTGDKKDLYRLARKSFLISATDGGGDEYDFIHSENIVVIDQNGKIRNFVNGTAEHADSQILRTISKLK